MRVRPSDEITDKEFRIGICRNCGRYGQIDYDHRICKLPVPTGLVGKEFFKRVRYCQRVSEKRANKK
jgi:hypothetical protein